MTPEEHHDLRYCMVKASKLSTCHKIGNIFGGGGRGAMY